MNEAFETVAEPDPMGLRRRRLLTPYLLLLPG